MWESIIPSGTINGGRSDGEDIMELGHFISIIAAILGFAGAIFLGHGVLSMSPDIMSKLSQTYWDYSLMDVKNLSASKADYLCGVALIVIAFGLQMLSLIFIRDDCKVFDEYWTGVIIGLILCLCTIAVFIGINKYKTKYYENKVMAILKAQKK